MFWNFQALSFHAHTHTALYYLQPCGRGIITEVWYSELDPGTGGHDGKTDEIQSKSGVCLILTDQSWFLVLTNLPSSM